MEKASASSDDDNEDEDEPKPKGKKKGKKGKKKPAGSPVMLFVLIGIGALVLIGGAAGVYYGFIKEEDKPTNSSSKGGTTGATPGLGGVPATPAAAANGWVEVHEEGGRYRVKFPSQPKKESKAEDTPPFGLLDSTIYFQENVGEAFNITHAILPQDRMGLTDEQVLDAIVAQGKKKVEEQNGALKDERPIKHLGYSARSITVEFPVDKKSSQTVKAIVLVILAEDRIISLFSFGLDPNAHAPRAKAFLDSLKIE